MTNNSEYIYRLRLMLIYYERNIKKIKFITIDFDKFIEMFKEFAKG